MEMKWCWRCQCKVHMLDSHEMELCVKARKDGKAIVEKEIESRGIKNYIWLTDDQIPKIYQNRRYLLEMHRLLTGYYETNPNAIWHHGLNQYGADCPKCKKPLRTTEARYCVFCGFGKDDLSKDTLPLTKRFSELFENKNYP